MKNGTPVYAAVPILGGRFSVRAGARGVARNADSSGLLRWVQFDGAPAPILCWRREIRAVYAPIAAATVRLPEVIV